MNSQNKTNEELIKELQELNASLEERVKERTAQLENAQDYIRLMSLRGQVSVWL